MSTPELSFVSCVPLRGCTYKEIFRGRESFRATGSAERHRPDVVVWLSRVFRVCAYARAATRLYARAHSWRCFELAGGRSVDMDTRRKCRRLSPPVRRLSPPVVCSLVPRVPRVKVPVVFGLLPRFYDPRTVRTISLGIVHHKHNITALITRPVLRFVWRRGHSLSAGLPSQGSPIIASGSGVGSSCLAFRSAAICCRCTSRMTPSSRRRSSMRSWRCCSVSLRLIVRQRP